VRLGIKLGERSVRRAQQRETELVRAQLEALKLQVQPHFLYNTLNAIMVLVRQQRGREAEETLGRLSDLLRSVLDGAATPEVTLRRELAIVRLYLDIEELRFGDRLRVELDAPAALLDAAVPQLALQPLVENAIRHGIGRRAGAGRLGIRAAREDGALVIRVSDDGPGLAAASSDGGGIGLASTRARLLHLYGDAARLTLEDAPGGGAVATLRVPWREIQEDEPEFMEVNAVHHAHR
jgi:LytS/YehU family sensor histidine kinase